MKFFKALFFSAIMFMISSGVAFAGVFGAIKDKISGAFIWAIISVVLGVAGVFLKGIYDIKKAKTAMKEIADVVKKYQESKNAKSPGGKEITSDEWQEIGKESMEAVVALLEALPLKWRKKIGFVK